MRENKLAYYEWLVSLAERGIHNPEFREKAESRGMIQLGRLDGELCWKYTPKYYKMKQDVAVMKNG